MPAIEVAKERDERLRLTGGRMGDDGKPYVPAKPKKGQVSMRQWSSDSNFGKIARIVHRSRPYESLSPNMQRFVDFARRYTNARSGSSEVSTPTSDELELG